MVNPGGYAIEFFSLKLDKDKMDLLGAAFKKTIMLDAELLALVFAVLAFSLWRSSFAANSLLCFVDNNAARDVAISGSGRNITANCLIDFLLKLEMQSCIIPTVECHLQT